MAKKKKEKIKQLDLGLKSPLSNEIAKIKSKTQETFSRFELMRYAKDSAIWFLNTISFILILFQGLLVYLSYNKLPKILALVEFPLTDNAKLVDKVFILIIPIFSLIFFIFSSFTSYKEYNKEKELMRLLSIISTLSIIALTIHIFNQVYRYI